VIPPYRMPLTPEMSPKECADCAFLLDAIGIPYERRTTASGASLWVLPEHHARAAHELGAYLRENRRPAQAPVAWPRLSMNFLKSSTLLFTWLSIAPSMSPAFSMTPSGS